MTAARATAGDGAGVPDRLTMSPVTASLATMEQRTARLTVLIDPQKKKIFEEICAAQDLTPSQVVRRLIREYVVDNAGGRELPDWLRQAGRGD